MKLTNLPPSLAVWARGLSLCLLAAPAAAFGQQGYQVQGNYNPGAASPSRSATLLPQPYQQQPYQQQPYQQQPYQQQPYQQPYAPTAGTGLRPSSAPAAQPVRVYSPLPSATRTTTVPKAAAPVYMPPAQSTLPAAYAQQGVYAQPQPYPVAVQQPAPVPYDGGFRPTQTITDKDREQDRRITALERQKASPAYVPETPSGQSTRHVVRRGESLWGIAERYGVSESSIKAANRRSSDMVIEGETLLIPGTSGSQGTFFQAGNGTHIVRRGESLSKIAAAYRVSSASLQQANNITNPDLIQEGQALVIPVNGGSTSRPVVYNKPKSRTKGSSHSGGSSTSKPKETVVYSDVPAPGQGLGKVSQSTGPRGVTSYRVEAGDKIENVARTFNSTPAEIQRINKLSSPSLPAPGEEIIVPLPGSVAM